MLRIGRLFRFRIKPGLVVTLVICLALAFQWRGFRAGLEIGSIMIQMAAAGVPNNCSLYSSFRSAFNDTKFDSARNRILSHTKSLYCGSEGIELYQFESTKIWIPKGDAPAVALSMAEQESKLYECAGARVYPGDTVIDAGAHVGIFAKEALNSGASKVVAVEPVPINLECLRRNFKEEIAAGKIVIYPKGIWDKDAVLEMDENPMDSSAASFVIRRSGTTENLPLTSVDKMVQELGLSRVDFIKMDIEGSERRALFGARQTIQRYHPRMAICVYHLPDDPAVIPLLIKNLGQAYRQKCGACGVDKNRLVPRVFFFF